MANRKSGLGRGIDGLFPSYNTDAEDKKPDSSSSGKSTSSSPAAKTKGKGSEKSVKSEAASKASGKTSQTKTKAAKKTTTKPTTKPAAKEITEKMEEAIADFLGNNNGSVVQMKISLVEPNRGQPRKTFNEDGLTELAESVKQYGIIQPLLVQKVNDHYEIIAGERRWRAARLAGLKEVPVIVREYSSQELVEVSLIENIQREDLNPIEEALAYERLLTEFSLKQDEVAERVSKSRSTITNSLRLLKLDERVRQMVIEEKISAGHARALLAAEDHDLQYEIAQQVFDRHLSVREVEKLVRQLQKPSKKRETVKTNEALALILKEMEDKMKAALGTRVTVKRRGPQSGRIEIEYYSDDELERLCDLMQGLGRE